MTQADPPIVLEPGSPVADAVRRGQNAAALADVAETDAAYGNAVKLVVARDSTLWSALAADHVEQLLNLGQVTLALRRCSQYLDQAGGGDATLLLRRAEIRSSIGDHDGANADATAVRRKLAGVLTPEIAGRLHRVEALWAANRGDLSTAKRELDAARLSFFDAGSEPGLDIVDRDEVLLAVRHDDESAGEQVISGKAPGTVADSLLQAMALKRQLRYENALEVLRAAGAPGLDPALRPHLLLAQVVLLILTRQDRSAQLMLAELEDAIATSPDPQAYAGVAEFLTEGVHEAAMPAQFEGRVQRARRLVHSGRLDEASHLLYTLMPLAHSSRQWASWHLVVGELELERARVPGVAGVPGGGDRDARMAVAHLAEAVRRAATESLIPIRIDALRLLGNAYNLRAADGDAVHCWAEAHRLEEDVAGRQLTDRVRVRMLQAAVNEHDQRLRAAVDAMQRHGAVAAAGVVVAMEAARGATILDRVLPDEAGAVRNLPPPHDLAGGYRWTTTVANGLSRSQVAWFMHATPDEVHHTVLGQGLLVHGSVRASKEELTDAIDELMLYWSDEDLLRLSTAGEFDQALRRIADLLDIGTVIQQLPSHVRRVVIVAGGELADVPFTAMTVPGSDEPLGVRFALSSLPCLTARIPLQRRSRQSRGDTRLRVSPPERESSMIPAAAANTVLDGSVGREATCDRLREHLPRHRQVRIYCHGRYDENETEKSSWLQLMPAGPQGRLTPDELQQLDLGRCGTLVLGACESGMGQRVGRDERIGFVRAALRAGAASVVAARWIAMQPMAGQLLDRFERYLRYLPRDVALQRAQRDAHRGVLVRPEDAPEVPNLRHPAWWSCWTLYGDPGWQTGAGPVRRAVRRLVAGGR